MSLSLARTGMLFTQDSNTAEPLPEMYEATNSFPQRIRLLNMLPPRRRIPLFTP